MIVIIDNMNILNRIWHRSITILCHRLYPNIHETAVVDHRACIYSKKNLYMEQNTNLDAGALIMNTRAKFIVKKWSGAAVGLTVITGNHLSVPGMNLKQVTNSVKDKMDNNHMLDKDVIVEEDVWIASNVTLLSGVFIGRGAIVGSGSVVRSKVPPYAIVIGNPARIVGFRFTPDEVIEHEKVLYSENERLPIELLEKNYEKYCIKRIKQIKEYIRL